MVRTGKRDYYDVLGLPRTANQQDIKRAYRKLAVKYHPDKNPGDLAAEEAFKEAAEAYGVLGDPEKRVLYDQYGHAGIQGGPQINQDIFREFSDLFGGSLFEDLFGFGGFGSGRRRSRARRGSDLRYDLQIGFEEAVKGTETRIRIPRTETCPTCRGSGARPGTDKSSCTTCHGQGQVRFQQGFLVVSRPCGRCQGTGQIIPNPCQECSGHGQVVLERDISIKIPAGVDTGSRLRLAGEGEGGTGGGPAGDLYVVLQVEEHPFFKRQDENIYCDVPITFPQAALGADIAVPTIDGSEELHIPEGTQTGTVFRLRGKGVQHVRGHRRGDQLEAVTVVVPKRLSKEQRELVRRLAEVTPPLSMGEEASDKDRGFLEKLFG
ncbi:MAG: molecular chaperone DnaJ [Acidobacteriota bacterium]